MPPTVVMVQNLLAFYFERATSTSAHRYFFPTTYEYSLGEARAREITIPAPPGRTRLLKIPIGKEIQKSYVIKFHHKFHPFNHVRYTSNPFINFL